MSERDKTIGPWTIKGKLGEGGMQSSTSPNARESPRLR
jgi:hypothetical protein